MAKPAERSHIHIWMLGRSQSDRAQVTIDLCAGVVIRSQDFGDGWRNLAAGVVKLDTEWCWCWIAARSDASSTLGVLVTMDTAEQRGGYQGDGRSGAWFGNFRLEQGTAPTLVLEPPGAKLTLPAQPQLGEANKPTVGRTGTPTIEFRPRSRLNQQSRYLMQYHKNIASQVGQDGIFEKMLEIIGTENRWCAEFGAWDGKYLSNTWHLIHDLGWSGVLIEGSEAKYKELLTNHSANKVTAFNLFVDIDGENSLDNVLARTEIPADFDVLSIDIDGNDWHVWESLTNYRPRIVCIEFNPTISNDVFFVQEANPAVNQGCSLLALIELGKRKDYELVAVTSWDGIFVPTELFPKFEIEDNSIDAMFDPSRYETRLFQGYDGTFWAAGNLTVQWKRIPFQPGDLQVLPRALRKW